MTARPEFGAAIEVEGEPLWLPYTVEVSILQGGDWTTGTYLPFGIEWPTVTAIRLKVPRYDFVYLALERGMVPWFGGDEAPGDWDNQARPNTIWRSGTEAYHYMPEWSHENDACDIVGYVPLATSTALPLAQGGKLGWDADGMCDDHYRFACKECALPLAHPADDQTEEMQDRVHHLRSEVRRCNKMIESGKADPWWWEDRDRFTQELRDLEDQLAHPAAPQGGDTVTIARMTEEDARILMANHGFAALGLDIAIEAMGVLRLIKPALAPAAIASGRGGAE